MNEVALVERQLEQERRARKDVEQRLNDKSVELARANRELQRASRRLHSLESQGEDVRQQLESELRTESERCRQLERRLSIFTEIVRCTGEAVAITDREGKIIEVNPAYEHALGQSRAEAVGTVLYGGPADGSDERYRELWRSLRDDGRWAGEIVATRKNGEQFQSWVTINAISDEYGNTSHYIGVARDMTVQRMNEQQLRKLEFYDVLTQLPNRAMFNERLGNALQAAERDRSTVAVIHFNIDQFKGVNDTLGHPTGDRLLVEVSRRISNCIRVADTIARTGGDEFTILLTNLDAPFEAVYIVERLIETIGMPLELGDVTIQVGASAGMSFYPDDGQDGDTLLKNADLALHAAKERGRRQYCTFSPEMLIRSSERFSLSIQLDGALNKDEFKLAFQPIFNVKTGIADSVEALIRWQAPDGQWVPPGVFIPHAEATGLIYKIDCWVLERSCRAAASWARGGAGGLGIAVNLSAMSVQQPDMAEVVDRILCKTGLPPHLLTLEITETAVIADPHVARTVLERIVGLGVGLSVDDFGTGHSSLSYLTQFPIDCIKLDRLFVNRIGKDGASEKVIQSVLELARKLALRVVAEGIEEPEQQQFLAAAGCELMQGFYLVAPLCGDQFEGWLSLQNQPLPALGRAIDHRLSDAS